MGGAITRKTERRNHKKKKTEEMNHKRKNRRYEP
jgi:hypothetical protein